MLKNKFYKLFFLPIIITPSLIIACSNDDFKQKEIFIDISSSKISQNITKSDYGRKFQSSYQDFYKKIEKNINVLSKQFSRIDLDETKDSLKSFYDYLQQNKTKVRIKFNNLSSIYLVDNSNLLNDLLFSFGIIFKPTSDKINKLLKDEIITTTMSSEAWKKELYKLNFNQTSAENIKSLINKNKREISKNILNSSASILKTTIKDIEININKFKNLKLYAENNFISEVSKDVNKQKAYNIKFKINS